MNAGTDTGRPLDVEAAGDNDVACAVCAEPLSRVTDAAGETVGWVHRGEVPGGSGVDHVGVPVRREDVAVEDRCDFCSGPKPGWMLPTEAFVSTYGMAAGTGSSANFSCCEVCARLIRKDRWDDLVKRCSAASAQAHQISLVPELVEETRLFLVQVREHATGPVERVGR